MPNKVVDAVARAKNNFVRGDIRVLEEPTVSKAEALGIHEPPMSSAQKAGWEAAGAVAGEQWERKIATQENYEREKRAWEKQRNDQIWAAVQARRIVG
jgi:hypothetical protein